MEPRGRVTAHQAEPPRTLLLHLAHRITLYRWMSGTPDTISNRNRWMYSTPDNIWLICGRPDNIWLISGTPDNIWLMCDTPDNIWLICGKPNNIWLMCGTPDNILSLCGTQLQFYFIFLTLRLLNFRYSWNNRKQH